jgi:steroid delta-isomerase-like uncharacterized protein
MQDLIARLIDAWNSHDPERVAAFYSPDFQGKDVAEAAPQEGPDGVRQSFRRYMQAFPDLRFSAEDVIRDGRRVVLVWSAQGTHRGTLFNIPPTGRSITIHGVSVLTVSNDKISRALYIWDMAGLLRSMALLPELP